MSRVKHKNLLKMSDFKKKVWYRVDFIVGSKTNNNYYIYILDYIHIKNTRGYITGNWIYFNFYSKRGTWAISNIFAITKISPLCLYKKTKVLEVINKNKRKWSRI